MLVGLQQESSMECDMDAVVGSEIKDDWFRGAYEEMPILQLPSC